MRGLSVDEVVLYGYLLLQLVKIFDRKRTSSEACASIVVASVVAYAVVASARRSKTRDDATPAPSEDDES